MRPAGEEDVAFVAGLFRLPHARRYLNAPSARFVAASFENPNHEEYIVEREGEPAGYFQLKNYEWLFELGLLIACEPGRGLGRYALGWGMERAFGECKAHRVYAAVRASNVRTQRLLESFGMRAEGRYRDGFRNARTGAYEDLIPYGLLAAQYRRGA